MTDEIVKNIIHKFYLLDSIGSADLSFEIDGKKHNIYGGYYENAIVEGGCIIISRGSFKCEYFNIKHIIKINTTSYQGPERKHCLLVGRREEVI